MKMPYVGAAVVTREKVLDYLLNSAHPDNGGKASFFLARGYTREDWPSFAAALRSLASEADIAKSVETAHGIKYVVDGGMESPDGRRPVVRTIWIVEHGVETPRLVTAYPCED